MFCFLFLNKVVILLFISWGALCFQKIRKIYSGGEAPRKFLFRQSMRLPLRLISSPPDVRFQILIATARQVYDHHVISVELKLA